MCTDDVMDVYKAITDDRHYQDPCQQSASVSTSSSAGGRYAGSGTARPRDARQDGAGVFFWDLVTHIKTDPAVQIPNCRTCDEVLDFLVANNTEAR